MRRLTFVAALLLPVALAVASLAPVVLIEPTNDLAAYAPLGYDAHSTDYWYPPARYDDVMELSRFNQDTLAVAATGQLALVGPAFAGDSWTFTTDLVQLGEGPGGDAVLSFTDSELDEPYLAPIRGLHLMARRDATGGRTLDLVMAVGARPPYSVVPFVIGRHRIVISSSWAEARVRVDGALVWSGDPGWSDFEGAYPILHLAPGHHRVSVVPAVDVSFFAGERANPAAFRAAFVDSALGAQDGDGAFSEDNRTDAWTALALVLEHRRTGETRIADALDRWAEGRVAEVVAGHAWPGEAGPRSIRENVGEPGIALGLWARDRGRDDWARVVTTMIESAGFTDCKGGNLDWCRLGDLQPDGSVIRAGEPGANDLVVNFQFAETAGFIAGADLSSRRDWIRSLVQRIYPRLSCQVVEILGPNKHEMDARPWSPGARRGHPAVMFLLGLAYAERPDDPVWSEPAVQRLLTCGMSLLRTQVGGPMGWRTDEMAMDFAIGSQDVAASRLLAPLVGTVIERDRFDVAWERLIDPVSLRARIGVDEPTLMADYSTAVAAVMLEVVEP